MRWDRNYKQPEVINDPVVIPAYGVTDVERAYWNAKQETLEYDRYPTLRSDKHCTSGVIHRALEDYKTSAVELSQAFFWGQVGGLAQTKAACEASAEAAAESALEAASYAESAAGTVQSVIEYANDASASASNAAQYASNANSSKEAAVHSASDASGYATNAANSASTAAQSALDAASAAETAASEAATETIAAIQPKVYDAEAWAKGTRNGVPVSDSDEAYHNNAKYYAGEASSALDVIDDTTISQYTAWSSNKVNAELVNKADLVNGKVPASQLPSYVDDVVEGYYNVFDGMFYEEATFETMMTPEASKIYTDLATNNTYRWSGSAYIQINAGLALGETVGTAYEGSKGKANADAISALQAAVAGKVDSSALATVATSGLYNDLDDKPTIPTVSVSYAGTASASSTRQQQLSINGVATDINGTKYMQQDVTLSTSAATSVTFTSSDIMSDSIIEVFAGRSTGDVEGGKNEFPHSNIYTTSGSCVITFPAIGSAITIRVKIYIRG